MLSKMLRASRQNRAVLNKSRSLLTMAKRNFSSEESSLAAAIPGSGVTERRVAGAKNMVNLTNINDYVRQ